MTLAFNNTRAPAYLLLSASYCSCGPAFLKDCARPACVFDFLLGGLLAPPLLRLLLDILNVKYNSSDRERLMEPPTSA